LKSLKTIWEYGTIRAKIVIRGERKPSRIGSCTTWVIIGKIEHVEPCGKLQVIRCDVIHVTRAIRIDLFLNAVNRPPDICPLIWNQTRKGPRCAGGESNLKKGIFFSRKDLNSIESWGLDIDIFCSPHADGFRSLYYCSRRWYLDIEVGHQPRKGEGLGIYSETEWGAAWASRGKGHLIENAVSIGDGSSRGKV
jgi:hypothetical protein